MITEHLKLTDSDGKPPGDERGGLGAPGRPGTGWRRFLSLLQRVPPRYRQQLMTRLEHEFGVLEVEAGTVDTEDARSIATEAGRYREQLSIDEPQSYPAYYARLRDLRVRLQLAVESAAGVASERSLKRIAADEASTGGQSVEAQALLRNLSQGPEEGGWSPSELRRILRCFWECDASSALEQLDVHSLTRISIGVVMGLFFFQYWIMTASSAITNIGVDLTYPGLISTVTTLLFAPVFSIEFQAGFFGMIGVILSFTLESAFHPSTAHWRFVRNSSRSTRFMVGFLIGVLVARFLPFLVAASEPLASVAADAVEDTVLQDAQRFRVIFFAMVFGFSQDAFLKRVLSVGQPSSAKTS